MFDLKAAGLELYRLHTSHWVNRSQLMTMAEKVLGQKISTDVFSLMESGKRMMPSHILWAACVALEGPDWGKAYLRIMRAGMHRLTEDEVRELVRYAARKAAPAVSQENGHALRRARLERGLTQKEFAKMCGCSSTMIGKIETGKRTLRKDEAVIMAKILDYEGDPLDLGGTV